MLLARCFCLSLVALTLSLPTHAWALPHSIFDIRPGTQRDKLVDGSIPQSVVTIMLSNSSTACKDWRTQTFAPGKKYLLTRLFPLPTGDAFAGCYDVGSRTPGSCGPMRRGPFDGIEFVAAAPEENAGRATHAKFATGGHVTIDAVTFHEDGTGTIRGFANLLMGNIATGGVIEADYCPPLIIP